MKKTATNVMAAEIYIILVTLVEDWGKHIIIHLKLSQKSAIIAMEQANYVANNAMETDITFVSIVKDTAHSDALFVMGMEL